MRVLIDNYDSFSYNLYQIIGSIDPDIKVIRNDESSVAAILKDRPQSIILSPGPGKPKDAGICEELIKLSAGQIPILGICLGHQAICEVYGAHVTYAPYLMHGKQSVVTFDLSCILYEGLEKTEKVGRYHSLTVENELSDQLALTAVSEDGIVMGVKVKEKPIYGLQFHPESILTPCGKTILNNFINHY